MTLEQLREHRESVNLFLALHGGCRRCKTYTVCWVGMRPVKPVCFCECHRKK